MTDKELLELLKGVVALATPLNSNGVEITSLDTPIADTGLDSLDLLMVIIYLSDVYGVSEEDAKTMEPVTIRDIFQFMAFHSTKQPTSVEAALNDISN
jgi:acyl carrier protein